MQMMHPAVATMPSRAQLPKPRHTTRAAALLQLRSRWRHMMARERLATQALLQGTHPVCMSAPLTCHLAGGHTRSGRSSLRMGCPCLGMQCTLRLQDLPWQVALQMNSCSGG